MINRILNHLEEWLIAFLIGAATSIIFVAVVQRSLAAMPIIQNDTVCQNLWIFSMLCSPLVAWIGSAQHVIQDIALSVNLTWAQELCIFMFVWMAKFGAAYGVRTGIHVGVDVIIRKLTGKPQRMLILFGLLAGALFTGTVATLGANFVWHIGHTDQTSADLEIPMWWVYLCVPLGSSLMCYRFLQVAWSFLQTGELPHHDHTHVEGIEDDAADELLTVKGATT